MLEDGAFFKGISCGYHGEAYGEIVFNTSMTGYQEILTDPSYKGQIVAMTCPQIGNYGVNKPDAESAGPCAEGFVMKELSRTASNWRSEMTLREYLEKNKIPAIEGIDTRKLTRHIRDAGAMKSVLSSVDVDTVSLLRKVKASPSINNVDLVRTVTAAKEYEWPAAMGLENMGILKKENPFVNLKPSAVRRRVAAIDCGIKHNILRILASLNCEIRVFPASVTASKILEYSPDGIFISNGPGDPSAVPHITATIRELLGKKPVFGICFGHQLLAQALGAKTYKLKFGHRGANHPVIDTRTGIIDITTQNHGFAVDSESLKNSRHEVIITHINLNDKTIEGIEAPALRAFSVQHHPEASAGPHDARNIFNRFIDLMDEAAGGM